MAPVLIHIGCYMDVLCYNLIGIDNQNGMLIKVNVINLKLNV